MISWIGILKIDDDGYPLVDENGSTLVSIPREGPLDEDEASSLTAWAQGCREVRKICAIQSQDVVIINPSQAVSRKSCARLCSRRNHRDETENIPTAFRDKARDHSTERITGAELRKRTRCYRCRHLGHMARECQNKAMKDALQSSAKNFFLPGDAFAQLHNLSSYMSFDGASKTVVECNFDPKHPEFIGLILGPARGLTDTGAQQPVVGSSASLRWCDRLLKRHGLVPLDVTPSNMIATCGGIGTAKVVQVLAFPCWNRGCERSDAIPGARGAHVDRWKTTVHSTADTNHENAPVGSKHPNGRIAVMCWKSRTTAERSTRRSWSESDLDTCTISWTSFREKVGNCLTACALSSSMIRSLRAIVVRNVRMGSTSSRTKNK